MSKNLFFHHKNLNLAIEFFDYFYERGDVVYAR